MITNNKLSGFLERVNGEHKPITADVFLTDFCNEKCVYCRFAHKTGNYIHFDDFCKYAERLVELGVKGIILTGGGEPSVNPDYDKICAWLESKGIPYGVNTNLVDMHYINPVYLKVSIDAGTKEQYKKMRGVDFFEHVRNNLYDYVAYRDKSGSKTNIGVQCVAMNTETVKNFYEAVKNIGVDYIYFRPFENNKNITTKQDVLEAIDEIAKKDNRVVKSYKFNLSDWKVPYCIGNWSVLTVKCDGSVPYCCHRPDEIVGHIMDNDIIKKMTEYNVDMAKCETPCRLSGVNNYLVNYKKVDDYCFV